MRLADLTWLEAERLLHEAQITLRYTDILAVAAGVEGRVTQQLRGSHADETETSMMLYLTPERVDMRQAVKDDHPRLGEAGFSRLPNHQGIYSASGVWGDATLAEAGKENALSKWLWTGLFKT